MKDEKKITQGIREQYMDTSKKKSKFEELIALDKRAKLPAEAFGYGFGISGTLLLGTGMCFAMEVVGKSLSFAMPLGIIVGVFGIGMVALNYFIYRAILKKRKKKYGEKILRLSNELLHE